MAEVLFTALAIYKDGQYVANDPNNEIAINAPKIDGFSPRNVWLLRQILPGQNQIQYLLTFDPTSEELLDANTLQGIYVEQDGEGVMIDCISMDDFITVANGTGAITPRYGSAQAFTGPSTGIWCITRTDDGSTSAHSTVCTDYVGQYVGNIRLKSNITGVSVYVMTAYGTPKAMKSDSIIECYG